MEVKRRPNESTGSLLRRFSRLAQQTKLVINAKSKLSRKRKLTDREQKKSRNYAQGITGFEKKAGAVR